MIVAGSTHLPKGFFNTSGGYELRAAFGLVGRALAFSGPGRFSLDHLLGHTVNRKWLAVATLASTIGSAAYLTGTRQQPPSAPAEPGRAPRTAREGSDLAYERAVGTLTTP